MDERSSGHNLRTLSQSECYPLAASCHLRRVLHEQRTRTPSWAAQKSWFCFCSVFYSRKYALSKVCSWDSRAEAWFRHSARKVGYLQWLYRVAARDSSSLAHKTLRICRFCLKYRSSWCPFCLEWCFLNGCWLSWRLETWSLACSSRIRWGWEPGRVYSWVWGGKPAGNRICWAKTERGSFQSHGNSNLPKWRSCVPCPQRPAPPRKQ